MLCVEDDPDIRTLIELALRDVGGLEVRACGSGPQALELLPRLNPDVILLDVMMPEMDGMETCERIRSTTDKPPPVIFMTAKVQPREVERYMALGAIGVIAKPFDPMRLATEVRHLWQEGRTRGS